jgi:hypothetical protein
MSEAGMVVYEEVTTWPIWVSILVWGGCLGGVVVSLGVLDDPLGDGGLGRGLVGAAAIVLVPVALKILLGRLRVRVTRTELRLTIGYTPFIAKTVEFDDIVSMEPVRYSPLREFGGWGIRRSFKGGKRAWTMSGNRALVLTLPGGTRFYVGSSDPVRLESRIRLGADIPEAAVSDHE